jgi:DNA polymerase I-like protein with 3'-5' exonuclease and polymerase domains
MTVVVAGRTIDFVPWRPGRGRVFERTYGLALATTRPDPLRPWLAPPYVVGAASDGERGYFLARQHASAFLTVHNDLVVAMHDAPFAFDVLYVLEPTVGVYDLLDRDSVRDTQLMHRLLCLAAEGHTAGGVGQSTLGRCAKLYLNLDGSGEPVDSLGGPVRTSYGRWLGRDPREIEPIYLAVLAEDAVLTRRLDRRLRKRLLAVLRGNARAWAYVSDEWLADQIQRWGPATLHIQLKAAIVLRRVAANGLRVDVGQSESVQAGVRSAVAELRSALVADGYLPGQKGSRAALEKVLARIDRRHAGLEIARTADGRISTSADALAALAEVDPFVRTLLDHQAVETLETSFLSKMGRRAIHPSFDVLKTTGRTSSFGALNAQNLPCDPRIRRCFVPRPGHVLAVLDYAAIEMATLAQACEAQFGLPSRLADALNAGRDPHRMVAALATGRAEVNVTDDQRQMAKPINFGKPGAMGHEALKRYARSSCGIELSDKDVEALSEAWFALFPEMRKFLRGESDAGMEAARFFGLTPRSFYEHTGSRKFLDHPEAGPRRRPSPILGWMALRAEAPETGGGRPYDAGELDYFWARLAERVDALPVALRAAALARRPSPDLRRGVMGLVGRGAVFTATGRLRAGATFAARHNNIFQGVAADGAKLALWLVWRAGYRIVNFIHDELVVELPAGPAAPAEARRVAALMVAGMRMVVPDVRIAVEYALATSWATRDRVGEAAVVASDDPDFADLAAGAAADVVATGDPGRRRPGRTPRRSRAFRGQSRRAR